MGHYGDQKSYKGRGGWGGSSSPINYDAEERAASKRWYDKVKVSDDPTDFLKALPNNDLLQLVRDTKRISRYGDYDWNRIVAMVPNGEMEAIRERIEEAREEEKGRKQQEHDKWMAGAAKREEEAKRRAKEELERQNAMVNESRLMAGYLHSELANALRYRETYDRSSGDWLDSPVDAITGQGGFGEEERYGTGIHLEVNLALDCSNSMYYNDLAEIAVSTFRTLYLALDIVKKQLPDSSLTINAWLWAEGEDGKGVNHLDTRWRSSERIEVTEDKPLGAMEHLPSETFRSGWSGEDTWLYALLEGIDEWENKEGNPGAFRLDIILTDGVFEHLTDARKGDEIQYRRNGNLQTVLLNFLPVESWGEYRVPNRCVQYPATLENVAGLMRSVLGSWITQVV